MQKRMRHAHPRTPGGRNFIPKSKDALPWGKSKFMPPKQQKFLIAPPKKEGEQEKAEG